jgi:hypothetical protein
MGRQVVVALSDSDEVEFLHFLRQSADIQLFESFASTESELRVDAFGTRAGHWSYTIWNRAFPWEPVVAQTRQDLADPSRRGLFYIANKSDAPLLEYSRHSLEPSGPDGRLYWSKYFAAPKGLAYNVVAFEQWYESVVRWLRRHKARSNYALKRTVREEVPGAIMRCGPHGRLA